MTDTSNIKLIAGIGSREDDELCVMSLVALIAGEKHTDRPVCACPVLTPAAIVLNDTDWWLSDAERTNVLTPLAAELVGTRSTSDVALLRAELFVKKAFRMWIPQAFENAARLHPVEQHAAALRKHAEILRTVDVNTYADYADYAAATSAASAASAAYAAHAAASHAADGHAADDATRAAYDAGRAAYAAAYDSAHYDDAHYNAGRGAYDTGVATRAAGVAAANAEDKLAIRDSLLSTIREAINIK
jgi:hypothetical protein